jgi:hypothetical protein
MQHTGRGRRSNRGRLFGVRSRTLSFGACSRRRHFQHRTTAGADDPSRQALELFPNFPGFEQLETEVTPVLPLPFVDDLCQWVGGAEVVVLQNIAFNIVDRQDEVVAPSLCLGVQKPLKFFAAGSAREVAGRDDRDEEARAWSSTWSS